MGVYTRYKKDQNGFRKLVELLETTPPSRRQKLIDAGMKEDPAYTKKALDYILSFDDILMMPEPEITELASQVKPKVIAYALENIGETVRTRVENALPLNIRAEVKSYEGSTLTPGEIGSARVQLISAARQLEQQELIKTKAIPTNVEASLENQSTDDDDDDDVFF